MQFVYFCCLILSSRYEYERKANLIKYESILSTDYNKLTHNNINMQTSKYQVIILLIWTLALLSYSAQISVGRHEVSMLQKRKVYCSMMSYHFLDYDMDTFKEFTEGFSQVRSEVFKSKVAAKLSQNCQQKITNQQLRELSKLVENPQNHQQQIQSLQHKYIQYFTPEQNIILSLLHQVHHQTQNQIQRQLNNYNTARLSMQQYASQIASGFKALSQHINQTTHHTVTRVNKFMESLLHLHGNISTGWTRFSDGLMKSVQGIKGQWNQTVDGFHQHPHVKTVKEWWDGMWGQEL